MARRERRISKLGELNARQERFVVEYLKDRHGTRAAIRAGYSPKSAAVQSSALLSNPKVVARLNEALKGQQERLQVRADDVLRELMRVALCDVGQAFDEHGRLKPLHEIPEDVRRAISSIDVEEIRGDVDGQVRKIRFWSKMDGLDKLGKHLRLFGEQVVTNPDDSASKIRALLSQIDEADGLDD